jgi:hypothetical protein
MMQQKARLCDGYGKQWVAEARHVMDGVKACQVRYGDIFVTSAHQFHQRGGKQRRRYNASGVLRAPAERERGGQLRLGQLESAVTFGMSSSSLPAG